MSVFLLVHTLGIALVATFAMAQSTPTVKSWNASNITWQITDPDGAKHAILEGDKNAPGKAFTYAAFVAAGSWDHHTHSHNQDARVAVVAGALLPCRRAKPRQNGGTELPCGELCLCASQCGAHDGADVDTIIIGTAVGPWMTHDNPEPHHH